MPFKFKLSRRLARLRVPAPVTVLLAMGCVSGDKLAVDPQLPQARIVRLLLTPSNALVPTGKGIDFSAVGLTASGDTAPVSLTWFAKRGRIIGSNETTPGTRNGHYQSPDLGQVWDTVVVVDTSGLADTSTIAITDTAGVPLWGATLRELGAARGLLMGTEVDMRYFPTDSAYQKLIAEQYGSVVAGNSMKFLNIHPGPTEYYFSEADRFVAFAESKGIAVHGHTLVWHQSLPSWIAGGTFTRAQLLAILKDHILTVVGRYRGRVSSWDVLNEAVDQQGRLKNTIWRQVIGSDYVDSAFAWTHEADPAARLYLNDAGAEGLNVKSDSILALVRRLRDRGVPIHGVGFESHFTTSPSQVSPVDIPPPAGALRENFARYAAAGFEVRVSEIDVKVADSASAEALIAQAVIYRDALDACLLLGSQCGGFTSWGSTDRESWIPGWYPGFGRALPFDTDLQPKPAADSLAARLRRP